MTGITGQQSAPGGARYKPWIQSAEGQRYRHDIDIIIAATLAELLAEDGASAIGPLTPHHASISDALAASLALDGRHGVPLRVRGGPDGAVHTLHTRAERRGWRDAWARHIARLHDRAVMYAAEIHAQFDAIDYTVPVYDSEGQVLTGSAEINERHRLFGAYINNWHHVGPADGYQHPQARRNRARIRAALTSTRFDPTPGALASDVPTARGQLMDRLDDAAKEMRRWLLDGPASASAANAAQEAALRLVESRRQAGRRDLRTRTTIAALQVAATTAVALIRGAGVEDAPAWQGSNGLSITGGRVALTYGPPGTGRWTHALRGANPTPSVASKAAADLGDVVLDDADLPTGWTVTSAPRPAPAAHERDVTVAWSGAGAPAAGTHTLTLTARNACGPSNLTVTITVPAAPTEE